MDKRNIIIIFGLCDIFSTGGSPTELKKFRNDYEYNKRTDAFYKLHVEMNVNLWRSNDICVAEGAELMVPRSDNDIAQIHGMMKKYPDIGNLVYVANDGQEHESAEETPIIDLSSESGDEFDMGREVITRDGKVELISLYHASRLPFACKVEAKKVIYDSQCGIYVSGYRYFQSVGSCYKVPRIAYTWYQAYAECQAEGAHLAIINSEAESRVLKNITESAPYIPNSIHAWYFHIGFKVDDSTRNTTRVFKTIFNQTLEEAGFTEWSATEPNNLGGREMCGSVFKDDGKLNDIYCDEQYGFVCEKEVTA